MANKYSSDTSSMWCSHFKLTQVIHVESSGIMLDDRLPLETVVIPIRYIHQCGFSLQSELLRVFVDLICKFCGCFGSLCAKIST